MIEKEKLDTLEQDATPFEKVFYWARRYLADKVFKLPIDKAYKDKFNGDFVYFAIRGASTVRNLNAVVTEYRSKGLSQIKPYAQLVFSVLTYVADNPKEFVDTPRDAKCIDLLSSDTKAKFIGKNPLKRKAEIYDDFARYVDKEEKNACIKKANFDHLFEDFYKADGSGESGTH